jgi:hypothetical protein
MTIRRLAGLVATIAFLGCGGPGSGATRSPLVAGATLEDVSPGGTRIAYSDPNGLSVMELATGATQVLAPDGFDARFAADDLLLFRSDRVQPPTGFPQGKLRIWRPGFTQAARVTNQLSHGTHAPDDASMILVEDGALDQLPSLEELKTTDCTPASCTPTTLSAPQVTYRWSTHAQVVAWESANQLFVHDLATGQTRQLPFTPTSNTPTSNAMAVSADGRRVAVLDPSSLITAEVVVFDTATGARLPWSASVPNGNDSLAFLDDDTVLVTEPHMVGGFTPSVHSCTASSCIPTKFSGSCSVERLADGSPKWVYCYANCYASRCAGDPGVGTAYDLGGNPLVNWTGGIHSLQFNTDKSVLAYAGSYPHPYVGRASLPDGVAWNPRPGVDPVALTPSLSIIYRTSTDATGRLVVDDGTQTSDLAGPVSTFVVRGATVWYDVTAPDPATGALTPGIYTSPAP